MSQKEEKKENKEKKNPEEPKEEKKKVRPLYDKYKRDLDLSQFIMKQAINNVDGYRCRKS